MPRRPYAHAPAADHLAAAELREFSRRVRRWFRRHGRDLPWRRTRDPYEILVSELMLQQTQVARVTERYPAFLARFPTLAAVAAAPPGRVTEAWAGLGYYARARHLHALAREVERRGGAAAFPSDPAELRRLPGVGAYTAGAVASFAFERRAPLVDTNVARVLRRVFDPGADPRTGAGRRRLWALAAATLPRTGRAAWTHNQGVMELGALVCTARVARCPVCPVRTLCRTAVAAERSPATRTGRPTTRRPVRTDAPQQVRR